MGKKILKITGITLAILLLVLAVAPFLFKDKIKQMVTQTINENVDATVAFEDVGLSFFKNFPKASVSIDKISIINKAPFEGDTLFYGGRIDLKMSLTELFKSEGEPMRIDGFYFKDGKVNIIFNKEGIGNFDIALKDQKPQAEETAAGAPFSMNVQEYKIENLRFRFEDQKANMKVLIADLNHSGSGNFGSQKLDLTTKTTAKLSVDLDKTNYMRNVALSWDAILAMDLEAQKYTFKDNTFLINQLPLQFAGFVQLKEQAQLFDMQFKTPTSSFKNLLGLIPEAYAGSLNGVKTQGDFTVIGNVKGQLTETTIPTFSVAFASHNASFQYPDLPKSVQNIQIDTKISNQTGILNDTYVNINQFAFRIDQDTFSATAHLQNLMENPQVKAQLKGVVNLANVTKAYPVKLDKPLTGILKANVATAFDMQSVENAQYQNIQNQGLIALSGFQYTGPEMAQTVQISNAEVAFTPNQIRLNQFNMKTGKSDLSLTGGLDNFYGFMFKNQILKGDFVLRSNQLAVSDFMTTAAPVPTKTSENQEKDQPKAKPASSEPALKIPGFLDCRLTASANTVLYDNLTLKAVSGTLLIKDEAVSLQNLSTQMFEGIIAMNGTVSTKGKVPTFSMNLGLDKVDIAKSVTQLDMLSAIAPIAGVVEGKLNSTITLSGNLDAKEMTPDLKSLSGDLFGQLLSATVKPENSQMLTALSGQAKFLDLSKLNLNDLKTALSFKDGKVTVKPFELKYQDVKAVIGGTHGFDQAMQYDVKMDVPVKYLGPEVGKLVAKLTPADQQKLDNVPVTALMGGTFKNPKVSTDMKQAVNNVTAQLVKYQKDKIMNQGTTALGSLFHGNKDKNSTSTAGTATPKDSVKTTTTAPVKEEIKNSATNAVKNLFGKKKQS